MRSHSMFPKLEIIKLTSGVTYSRKVSPGPTPGVRQWESPPGSAPPGTAAGTVASVGQQLMCRLSCFKHTFLRDAHPSPPDLHAFRALPTPCSRQAELGAPAPGPTLAEVTLASDGGQSRGGIVLRKGVSGRPPPPPVSCRELPAPAAHMPSAPRVQTGSVPMEQPLPLHIQLFTCANRLFLTQTPVRPRESRGKPCHEMTTESPPQPREAPTGPRQQLARVKS